MADIIQFPGHRPQPASEWRGDAQIIALSDYLPEPVGMVQWGLVQVPYYRREPPTRMFDVSLPVFGGADGGEAWIWYSDLKAAERARRREMDRARRARERG